MATRTVGIGIVGMGWMGAVHSRCFLQASERFWESGVRARLVACADDVESRARAGAEQFGFEKWTTNWREVIENPAVEVVTICTSNDMHMPAVVAAARAGKHVFCEKPLGRDAGETAEIARAAREAGVLTAVGYNFRWAPVVRHLKGLIESGELGDLTHYRGRFLTGYATDPRGVLSWRFKREISGWGTLGDLMSHAVDMARAIAGPVKRVVGNQETFIKQRPEPRGSRTHFDVAGADAPMGEVTNEDYVGALVQFANGAQGTLEACRIITGADCNHAFEVNGTKGAARWDFERMNEIHLYKAPHAGGDGGYTRLHSNPAFPFHGGFNPGVALGLGYEDLKVIQAHLFLKSILEGKQCEFGFEDALEGAKVLDAIQRSWQSERWETVETALD